MMQKWPQMIKGQKSFVASAVMMSQEWFEVATVSASRDIRNETNV